MQNVQPPESVLHRAYLAGQRAADAAKIMHTTECQLAQRQAAEAAQYKQWYEQELAINEDYERRQCGCLTGKKRTEGQR